MYLAFFGLNEKPFAITPDPRYLYLSERHAEALAHLLYGINEAGGFVQLTGEVGTGKTTVVRSLLAQTPKNAQIALILNPRMTAPEFLLTICEELGIGVPDSAIGSLKDLVDILSHYLLRAHSAGERIVLIVDEAQNLATDVLEQVRLLTNLETNTQKLLQIILIGQPELREMLARTELRQLAQRITGRYHLCPLLRQETAAYVLHRLRVAGATSEIFSARALAQLHHLSGGVPRVINVLCDRALLGAYTQDRHRVTAAMIRRSAEEVFGRRPPTWWLPWSAAGATVVVLALAVAGIWQFHAGLFDRNSPTTSPATVAPAHPPNALSKAKRAGDAGHSPQGGASAPPAPRSTAASDPPARHVGAHAPAPQTASLGQLLARHAAQTSLDGAFKRLFTLWGARWAPHGAAPCTQALAQGLQCFAYHGSLADLRLFDRPAILVLRDRSGSSHRVVLSGLSRTYARVDLGGVREVPIAALSREWFGQFVLLWHPPSVPSKALSMGMRGRQVRELREQLERLQGVPSTGPESDRFDAQLDHLVKRFQRAHRLAVDGVAGMETLVVLNAVTARPHSPRLIASDAHGS